MLRRLNQWVLTLDASQDEIEELESQSEKLRTEKKALMQQLLTGKRRVRA